MTSAFRTCALSWSEVMMVPLDAGFMATQNQRYAEYIQIHPRCVSRTVGSVLPRPPSRARMSTPKLLALEVTNQNEQD